MLLEFKELMYVKCSDGWLGTNLGTGLDIREEWTLEPFSELQNKPSEVVWGLQSEDSQGTFTPIILCKLPNFWARLGCFILVLYMKKLMFREVRAHMPQVSQPTPPTQLFDP